MDNFYKIKQGLNLRLKGVAEHSISRTIEAHEYALQPTDFTGITPRIVVKEGEHVLAGTPLFVDKATERIRFVSPVSGVIKAVERGERRKVLRVVITPDAVQAYKDFGPMEPAKADAQQMVEFLSEAGLFAFLRQRPYDVIATPTDTPKAIFVSAFSKMPLAADFTFTVKGQEEDFKLGIRALSRIAKVHLGIAPEQVNTPILPIPEAEVSQFSGPNPAGNVGVHINHVSPINKGETVWTMGAEAVIFVGRLMRTGKVDFTRTIAVAGSQVEKPAYVSVKVGAAIADIVKDNLKAAEHKQRIISGNPLVGERTEETGYLGAFATEVCVLPDGSDIDEAFGWIMPRMNQHSTSRSYFSWLLPGKSYDTDCRIKGGERHMIMSAEYEKVFPMDIYPSYLVKAILTGDIDRQEQLGIYEVAPEDFAVAEYVDSSKLELQRIVREGLDILRKENA